MPWLPPVTIMTGAIPPLPPLVGRRTMDPTSAGRQPGEWRLGAAGIIRRCNERKGTPVSIDIRRVGDDPVRRRPAMQMERRWLEVEGAFVRRIETQLHLVRHRR